MRILVAEDETIVRNLVQLMLSKEGYILLCASDGQEALELCDAFTGPIHCDTCARWLSPLGGCDSSAAT